MCEVVILPLPGGLSSVGPCGRKEAPVTPGCSVTTPSILRMLVSLSVRSVEEIGTGPPACRVLTGDERGRHTKLLGQERP